MLEYKIEFERPWMFAFVILAAFLIFFPYFRTPKNKRRSFGRIFSMVIRTIAVVVALFLMTGVTLTEEIPDPKEEAMVIVVDYSDSLSQISDAVEAHVGTILAAKSNSTEVRIVKFSGNAIAVTSEFTTDGDKAFAEFTSHDGSGLEPMNSTDINNALRTAADLFDPNKRVYKRIVLISDGRETTTDRKTLDSAYVIAGELSHRSIRLDTVSFDVTTDPDFAEVSMLSLGVLPDHVVSAGTSIRLQVKLRSSIDTDGVLHFYDGDKEFRKFPISLAANEELMVSQIYKTSSTDAGLHEFRVRYEPKGKRDAISENNELGTWVKVTGTPRVLLVGNDSQTARLYNQVKSIYDVDCCTPSGFPTTMKELLRYDEVVLMDVNLNAEGDNKLPDGADEMLNRFVHDIGRGLLTTSGTTQGSYASYSENESVLADMLPVRMTLDEMDHNVAIVIVIDDSSSMIPGHYNNAPGNVDKFQPALDGAQRVIEALDENDYVGIVTFHQEATVQLELTKPERKDELIALVQGLDAINHFGTDYSKGMNAARDMLAQFTGATGKHVIFLTDGYPNRGDFSQLPGSMNNAGISMSTIALLTDAGAKDLLADIAKEGGGKAYAIDKEEDIDNLSDIMEDLTVQAKEPQFVNTEPFNPRPGDDTGVLNQVQAAEMTLGGYIGSTPKSGSQVSLRSADNRPLIAEWQWGRGKVTTLMMDLASSWCDEFFSEKNNGFGLIKNMVYQSLNKEVKASGISVSAQQIDRDTHLSVETSCYETDQVVKLYVYDTPDFYFDSITNKDETSGTSQTIFFDPAIRGKYGITLNSAGGAKYSATVNLAALATATEDNPAGDESDDALTDTNRTYYLCLTQYSTHVEDGVDDEGNPIKINVLDDVIDYVVMAYSGGILAEYDLYNIDGKALLEGIALAGGGELMTSTKDLFSIIKEGVKEFSIPLMLPCTIVLSALILIDILCRNIRFKHRKKH